MDTTDFPDSTDIEGVATNAVIIFRMTATQGVVRLLSVSSALSVVFHFKFLVKSCWGQGSGAEDAGGIRFAATLFFLSKFQVMAKSSRGEWPPPASPWLA